MKVEKNKSYRVKGNSSYLKKKYGTPNPDIIIEDEDIAVFGGSWGDQQGNPACLLYAVRSAQDHIPFGGKVYYGKIGCLGEVVHETELTEIT